MKRTLFACLFGTAFALGPGLAPAVLIDFEPLAHPGDGVTHLSFYEEDGFRFTSNIDPILADMAFGVWGTAAEGYNGSTALFNTYIGFSTTLARIDGAPFRLTGMSLGPLLADIEGPVTFIGRTGGGGTVTRVFDFGPGLAPRAVWFGDDFVGLTSVTWEQEAASQAHQFDNVILDEPVPIPEPRAAALLGGGLLVLGLAAARRRYAARARVGRD